MSDYSLFRLLPIQVEGIGEVAPKGHISPALQAMMDAASRSCGGQDGAGAGDTPSKFEGEADTPDGTPKDAWGDLR